MSQRYAIAGLDEAKAYLAHPILGARLRACAEAALAVEGRSASAVFGSSDDMKLKSSKALYARATEPERVFTRVLEKYYGGDDDRQTLELLAHYPGAKRRDGFRSYAARAKCPRP